MVEFSLQHSFLRSIVDSRIDPIWLQECNWINLSAPFNNVKNKHNVQIFMYFTDDRKRVLYATDCIFAHSSENGLPWSQDFITHFKTLLPEVLSKITLTYSGLFINEFIHNNELYTLREFVKGNCYDPRIIYKYLEIVKEIIRFHVIPICFSEDLLLVDHDEGNILLPSSNYVVSTVYPVRNSLFKIFHYRLHPETIKSISNTKKTQDQRRQIANTGLYNPVKMKQYCTRLIDKEAAVDRIHCMSSLIHFFATLAVYWKLNKQYNGVTEKSKRKRSKTATKCPGICSLTINHLAESTLRELIHDYVCVQIGLHLVQKLKNNANSLYDCYSQCLSELQKFLIDLDC